MRLLIVCLLLISVQLCGAKELLPGSISPDGTRALEFEPEITGNPGIPSKFWVVELPSKRPLGSNLVPTDDLAYTVRFPNGIRTLFTTKPIQHALQNDQLLFRLLAYEGLRRLQTNQEGDVNYEIRWSNDLQRFTVVGAKPAGARALHKNFWTLFSSAATCPLTRKSNRFDMAL